MKKVISNNSVLYGDYAEVWNDLCAQDKESLAQEEVADVYRFIPRYRELPNQLMRDARRLSNPSVDAMTREELEIMIFQAAKLGKVEALKYLARLSDFDFSRRDEQGRTVFDYARGNHNYDVVHYLIQEGEAH